MHQIRRLTAIAGIATALTLALSGLPKVAEATKHTTGHQVGKLAVLAEICGYGGRARQIRTQYSNLPDFGDGYAYWRQYLGKYDTVRTPCGKVKEFADQLIGLNAQDLGAQDEQTAPAPDTEQQARRDPSYYNGRWKARSVDWIAELTLDDGNFRLRAECGQRINSEASGKMDDKGRINAILAPGKWYKVSVSGTINRLQFISHYGNCSKTTLKFERDN